MQLKIAREGPYLRAELRGRETAEQMREALSAILAQCRWHALWTVLLVTRASRPLFKLQDFGLASFLEADEYMATLAQQRGVRMRAFRSEAAAALWLRGEAAEPGRRYRFNRVVLAGAPEEPGVYALWQGDEVIYYGRATRSHEGGATIRSRLMEHFENAPAAATHYSWEISRAPAARESELLEQFRQAFGRLPRLNEAA